MLCQSPLGCTLILGSGQCGPMWNVRAQRLRGGRGRLSSQIRLVQKPGQPSPLLRATAGGQGSCSSLGYFSYTPASKTIGQNHVLGNQVPKRGTDLPWATATMGPKAPDSAVTASPPLPSLTLVPLRFRVRESQGRDLLKQTPLSCHTACLQQPRLFH